MMFEEYVKIAKTQAAADYGVAACAFDGGVHVLEATAFDCRAIKTKRGTPILDLISFGDGLVAVAAEELVPIAKEYLSRYGRNAFRAFDAPDIFELSERLSSLGFEVGEMAQGFLPSTVYSRFEENENTITLYGSEISSLYCHKEFGEALCYSTTASRRDVIAVAYCSESRPVAVAACSNDGEDMYQIGVDVLPEYRRRGLAAALVKRLTALIAGSGKCPYYRCAWSNIASRRTAVACGYSDAWVELSFRRKK